MREIQSLARGLRIIDLLVNSQKKLGITEIAKLLDVDKSTASRLVKTLQNYGYVQQENNSRGYVSGKRLHVIGWQLSNRYSLQELAKPFLDSLTITIEESSHIGVYSSGKALVTDDVQPQNSLLRVVSNSGRLIYLHNTALGKSLIAFGDFPMPTELSAFTATTHTTLEALEDDLALTRLRGYAVDDEENESGVRCIAAPVFDSMGVTVAAIGISGPTVRVEARRVEQIGMLVRDVACQLSNKMGYDDIYPNSDNSES